MRNIYVCGDTRSVYIRDFTEKVLQDLDGEKEIFFIALPADYEVYKKKNIHFLLDKPPRKKGIRSILEGRRTANLRICREHRPDIFIIHFVNPWAIMKYHPLWKKAEKRVLVFWGSDLYRMTERNKKLLDKYLPSVTDMIFMEENMKKEAERRFLRAFYDRSTGAKGVLAVHVIDFGMPLYDALEDVIRSQNKADCRKMWNIPDDRICLHIGYSGSKAQQHIELLEGLDKLPDAVKSKIYIVIPMGYTIDSEEYLQTVRSKLSDIGIDGEIFIEYLDKDDTARFRNTCDVFLYGQKTDGGSSSPVEYMYMGSHAIMPDWLIGNYPQLDAAGYSYRHYDKFDDIARLVTELIETADNNKLSTPEGTEALRLWMKENKSWDALAPEWKEVLI